MESNRRYKRFSVDVMNIKGKITVSNIVEVVDINTEEVKLKTDLRLNIGGEYVLNIKNDDNTLTFKGVVESSKISEPLEAPNGDIIPMYSAEMKLKTVSGEALAGLNSFIEAHNQSEEERLSGVGLHIKTHETHMDLSHGYKVKKISLGGMLIASGRAFEIDSGFPMEVSLPGNLLIRFMGRIASCSLANENDLLPYDIGIALLEITDQDRQILRDFIRRLDKEDEEEVDLWRRYKHI
jgi:hypothetical protein